MLETVVVQKALVVDPEGCILIMRRSNTDTRRPLQWDLPGGQLDGGEELIAGVEREIREETGLIPQSTRPIWSKTEHRTWSGGTNSVVFLFYVSHVQSIDAVVLSYEHCESRWLKPVKAILEFEYPLHREVLQYVIDTELDIL